MSDKVRVGLTHCAETGWLATVNGATFPVQTFEVQPPELGGRVLVSLLIPADAVQVGDVESATPVAPAVAVAPKVASTWGAPGVPDPRESIPGWTPEVTDASASASSSAPTITWQASSPEASVLDGLRTLIRTKYHGDVTRALG